MKQNIEQEKSIINETLLNSIPGGIIIVKVVENNIECLYFNEAFAKLSGRTHDELQRYLDSGVNVIDIINEVFGKQAVLIEQIEVYKDAANIITTEITEEQKADLVTKINEKYGTELSADNITIEEHSKIRGRDLIKPYIAPFAIATAIILVYFMIRYYKLNSLKVLLKSAGIIVLAQLVLLGIMAITRMQIGELTIPFVLVVYVLSLLISTKKFDDDLEKIKVEAKK